MFFSMEILKAKKGDCLLVHVGTEDDPTLILVDGGPSGVYKKHLRRRLEVLRIERSEDAALPIDLLMVSHIDDDHIKGILDLTRELRGQKKDQKPLSYDIKSLWHNSFDDVVGNHADLLTTAAHGQIGEASVTGEFDPDLDLENPEVAMVVASVPQGRTLRDDARLLGLKVNDPFPDLVLPGEDGEPVDPPLADGLDIVVVNPTRERVKKFQEEWDKELERRGLDEPEQIDVAAYLDKSVWNLASIVTLLRVGDKEMLLTGDGRGDDILAGMEEEGLLDGGKRHIDILKLPHHGSSNNVELDFFQRITADHYVMSGDGSHGNPNVETFGMIFEARRDDDQHFSIHLTYKPEDFKKFRGKAYPVDELEELIDNERANGREFTISAMGKDDLSMQIDLLDEFDI